MARPSERLEELGIELPPAPEPAADYVPVTTFGDLIFTAGQLPTVHGELQTTGRLGVLVDTDEGAQLARQAAINLLAVARTGNGGDLDGLRVLKLTVFVASHPGFTEQHLVADGASQLFSEVLGGDGVGARSAVGTPSLPKNSPVELEAVLQAAE